MSRKQIKKKKAAVKPESVPLSGKLMGMIREKVSSLDMKRLITLNIPYVIVFYLVDKVAW